MQEKHSNTPGKRGHQLLNIILSIIVIVGLTLAALYYVGTYQPSLSASRAALFENEKYTNSPLYPTLTSWCFYHRDFYKLWK